MTIDDPRDIKIEDKWIINMIDGDIYDKIREIERKNCLEGCNSN